MKMLHRSIEALEKINQEQLESEAEDSIWRELDDLKCEKDHPVELSPLLSHHRARHFRDAMEPVGLANERLKGFLAFIKTFEEKEFSTIYCEREWRPT